MLTGCILCQDHSSLTVSLKPPTAGVRIMSIDGGGTRGVLPLQHMLLLQEAVGDCPLNELFDLAVGTSSGASINSLFCVFLTRLGGFIVLGLFSLGWDVKKCSTMFDALARQLFGERWVHQRTILGRAKEWFSWWAADGKHDPKMLESTLQDHFGSTLRMFDSHDGRSSGPRVAVTATSISDATPFIFTNYNGVKDILMDCG
jgi:patatin-like phospholipase/acyl hydrolase